MAMSFADAFKSNNKGKVLLTQALAFNKAIKDRENDLLDLIYDTFVERVGASKKALEETHTHPELLAMSRKEVARLAKEDGPTYTRAMARVKSAWANPQAYRDAIDAVVPLAYCPKRATTTTRR